MVGSSPRIGVASLFQETNTFSPKPTGWDDFTVLVGSEAVEAFEGTNTEFAGVMAELDRLGAQAVPLVSAYADPSGRVTEKAFRRLVGLLDAGLGQAGRLDGLVLALHGSMTSESVFDADSALIEVARRWGCASTCMPT